MILGIIMAIWLAIVAIAKKRNWFLWALIGIGINISTSIILTIFTGVIAPDGVSLDGLQLRLVLGIGVNILACIIVSFSMKSNSPQKVEETTTMEYQKNEINDDKGNDEVKEEANTINDQALVSKFTNDSDKERYIEELQKKFENETNEENKKGIAKELVGYGYLYYSRFIES
jgi:hypothetical protein